MIHYYAGLPVPATVLWSAEQEYFVGECPHFSRDAQGQLVALAICQIEKRGEGAAKFGTPNVTRQRRIIAEGRCDLCGKLLKGKTKISLSRVSGDALAAEPLLHTECAKLSIQHCPVLQEQKRDGRLLVRRVSAYERRATFAQPEDHERYVPDYRGPPLLGVGAIRVLSSRDVTRDWIKS